MKTFKEYESEVRSYCRRFPALFAIARGSMLYDVDEQEYIDFLCGAGAVNYGHNNPIVMGALIDYMRSDGILMGLDLHTEAKESFIKSFRSVILEPRGLNYKFQFTSPTGTSVVESAIKLAKKCTGRHSVAAFTNAFHGMSGNSLSVTGSRYHRQPGYQGNVIRLPYDGYLGAAVDTVDFYRKLFEDSSSGVDLPAAIILETIQGEGGLATASDDWLRRVSALCETFGILLIVDDIQAGCGRSGKFFSFERAGITPDIVCLSKSIGAIGLPFALLLFKPQLDDWTPGEDNGTFRGNNLAFVAARSMLETYWDDDAFEKSVAAKEAIVKQFLHHLATSYGHIIKETKGLGLMRGCEFYHGHDADAVVEECFRKRLIVETCGPRGQVLKLMPALTIETALLERGLKIIEESVRKLAIEKGAEFGLEVPVNVA